MHTREFFRLRCERGRRVNILTAVMTLYAIGNASASRNIVEVRNPYAERPVESQSMTLEEDLRIDGGSEDDFFFSRIGDIEVDAAGRIYVVESSQHKVLVFDGDGTFIRSFGREGEGPGDFRLPSALTIDNDGLIYVADQVNVSIFDATHTFIRRFNYGIPGGTVNGIVLNSEDYIFLSCFEVFEQQIIHKYSNDGKRLASFCDSYAAGTKEDIRIEQTYAGGTIAMDDRGGIWYAQRTPYEIHQYSGLGELLTVVRRDNGFVRPPLVKKSGDAMEFFFGTASYGFGLLRDGTMINSIIVARAEREDYVWPSFIDVFSRDGQLLGSVGIEPAGLFYCADRSDRLYFLQYAEQQEVVRYRLKR